MTIRASLRAPRVRTRCPTDGCRRLPSSTRTSTTARRLGEPAAQARQSTCCARRASAVHWCRVRATTARNARRGRSDLILPSLRPYRPRRRLDLGTRRHRVPFLEDRLARHRYVAIGEFHVYGTDADLPVVRRAVELARAHQLVLHAHGDADAIERLFRQDPPRASCGRTRASPIPRRACNAGEAPEPLVRPRVPLRSGQRRQGRARVACALHGVPDRFMVGTDTFHAERWLYVGEHASGRRLAGRPPCTARRAHRVEDARRCSPRRSWRASNDASTRLVVGSRSSACTRRGAQGCGDALARTFARGESKRYVVAWRADPAPVVRLAALRARNRGLSEGRSDAANPSPSTRRCPRTATA